jgi:hypothetical protein
MNPMEAAARRLDRFQQRHGWMGFPVAVHGVSSSRR